MGLPRHRFAALSAALLLAPGALAQEGVEELPPLEVTAPAALPAAPETLPSSVSLVTRETITQAQYQVDVSESLARVPGLVANHRQNWAQDLQLSLRGFGARSAFGVRGLRLYTDGIPATMPDGQGQVSHFDLAGAGQIAVLRGPFSALYGASAGGVIELTAHEPAADSLELSGWGAAEAMQRYGLHGAAARDGWNAQASAAWFDTQGFRDHGAATRGLAQLRGALDTPGAGRLVLAAGTLDLSAQDPRGLTRAQWQQDERQAGANAELYDSRKTVRQSQFGSAWTLPLGDAQALRAVAWAGRRETLQFLAIPDTVQGTAVTNPAHPGAVVDLDRDYFGADLRWSARAGALDVALGADLQFMQERRLGFSNFTGAPGPGSTKGVSGEKRRDEDNGAESLDPYAQAQYRFAGDWQALAGVRRADVRFDSRDRFVIPGNGDDSGDTAFREWLPVAGLRWAPGPLALHVAASRGAETPTLAEVAYRPDGSPGLNTDLRAARSDNVEVGAAWKPAAGPAAELALFRTDTDDEIAVANSSGGRTTFRNAGATTREGVELALAVAPLPPLSATLAWTWLEARYDTPGRERLPGVPRYTLYGELAAGMRSVFLALEGLYRGDVTVDDAGSDRAPPYAVLNLRLAWALPGGWELLARADNLLDRRFAGSVIVNESNARYFEPAPGRAFGAGLRWSWRPAA